MDIKPNACRQSPSSDTMSPPASWAAPANGPRTVLLGGGGRNLGAPVPLSAPDPICTLNCQPASVRQKRKERRKKGGKKDGRREVRMRKEGERRGREEGERVAAPLQAWAVSSVVGLAPSKLCLSDSLWGDQEVPGAAAWTELSAATRRW